MTQKLRKGEKSFLCGTLCGDLIYISIIYNEYILKIVYGQKDGRTDGQGHAIMAILNGPIKMKINFCDGLGTKMPYRVNNT